MTAIRRRPLPAVAALLAICVCPVGAQSPPRGEYEIKAAYLFTFARFVEWRPQSSRDDSAFTICVLGTDPFGAVLDTTLAAAAIRGRKVGARRLTAADAATGCHIVFVGASEDPRIGTTIASLTASGTLTVSDMPRFAERGGMIQFVTTANRVRFEINLGSARQAGLTMSSELLKVASAVRNNTARAD
jgi:hypothetical protein